MADTSGELLGGRYRLLGERASFPFGTWWEAEDDQGARTLILRMHAEVVDPAQKARDALDVSAKIDTPHLVPWADGGVDGAGHGWLAAPMFGPWSLLEHVSRGEGGIPPVEAAPLMHQLARAVAAGEALGHLHHALSSELVRLVPLPDGGYGVKIYGYGLSELMPPYKPLRKQDAFLGVPDYMAPELCGGKATEGSSADIYALGILMYETVRGRPPFAPTFASASASATLKRHIFEKPLALHVRYANVPHIKSYETITLKALNKTANRRHLKVSELEGELEQLITGEMRSPVVPLAAISGRAPATSRRLRTQVLPSVAAESPSVVVTDVEAAPPAGAPTRPEQVQATSEAPAPAAAAGEMVAAEPERERNKRTEGTLVFAGLGPAVRELAETAKKEERAPAEAPAPAPEADVDGEEEGSSEEEALPASATGGGKKGKRKKGRKGSAASLAAAQTVNLPAAKVAETVAAPAPAHARSEAATGETPAPAASATAEPKEARVRRKDDSTVRNPTATDAVAAVAASVGTDKRKDEQEDWFAQPEEGEAKKPGSRAWILLLLAAAVVVVVIVLLTTGKGEQAAPKTPEGSGATAPKYTMKQETGGTPAAAPTETKPATAQAPPTPPAPVAADVKPAEPAPAEVKPVEPAAAEVKPAEPAPAPTEAKPATPPPTEVKPTTPPPTEAKPTTPPPTEVKPTTPPPTEVKPVATKPPEPKPAATNPPTPRPTEPKPAVTNPATPRPTEVAPAGSPEDQFKAQASHYMQLGITAFKAEKFGEAANYFRRAQAADPSNKAAGAYLKKAEEKLAQ